MKKISFIIITVICFLTFSLNVNAGVSVSASKSTITNGSTVTFYVKVTGAASWNIKGSSSGSTSGCKINEVGYTSDAKNTTKTFSATCKATSVGTIGFSATGDYTDENGSNKSVSGTAKVTVVKPRDPDSNNYLSALSVEGYEISPAFNKETLEYNVVVPSTVNEVTINANKASKYATLTGTGTVAVEEGRNEFEVKVVSETEIARVYKVIVTVEDLNPIDVKVGGNSYTLVKNSRSLVAPEGYTETTVTINNTEIPAFYNEVTKYTLVGLKDSDGNVSLFIYEDGTYTPYNELKSNSLTIIALDLPKVLKGYIEKTITIGNNKVSALVTKSNSKFAIIYGMNVATGEEGYYKYDLENNTMSRYDDELILLLQGKNQNLSYIVLATSIASAVFFILTLALAVSNGKKKSLMKKIIEAAEEGRTADPIKISKKKAKKEAIKEETVEETPVEEVPTEEPKKKSKGKQKQEVVEEKEEVQEAKEAIDEEETYDLFEDDKKKKKSKK